jgi:hypothetical protein
MKKPLGGLCEACHLLATAILFTAAFWLAPLAQPVRGWPVAGLSESALKFTEAATTFLLSRGPWFAALALLFAGLAGFLRGDAKRAASVVRFIASGAALLTSLWASLDLPAHRLPHAWNGVFVSCTSVLLLTGFLVSGGKPATAASKSGTSK